MQVKEVMTRGVQCARPTDNLAVAAAKMRDLDVGPLPVCGDHDRLVGMLTDRDITVRAVAEGQDPKATRVSEVMTPNIIYVFEDQDVKDVAKLMREKDVRRMLILNADKRLVGVVSIGDISKVAETESGKTLKDISEAA